MISSSAGDAYFSDAAAFRTNWAVKPNGKVLQDLLTQQWRTNTTLVTDITGAASATVYRGRLRVSVTAPGGRKAVQEVDVDQQATIQISL